MTAGFRACSIPVHRERSDAALRVVEGHPAVRSARYDGAKVHYVLDLGALPVGDGPAVEEVIRRTVDGVR